MLTSNKLRQELGVSNVLGPTLEIKSFYKITIKLKLI